MTQNSDLTTGNAGFDCTFQNSLVNVTVTFDTSPRYPDDGNGVAYDDQDSTKTLIIGPSPPPPVKGSTVTDIKAATKDELAREWASYTCNQLNSADGLSTVLSAGGLGFSTMAQIFADRESCYPDLEAQYYWNLIGHDPPDQNVLSVALPVVRAPQAARPCPQRASKRVRGACAAVRRLAQARDGALSRYDAVLGAMVTTLDRLSTAVAEQSSDGGSIQNAAVIAYAGELLSAGSAVDAADRALSGKLSALHLSPTQPRKQAVAGWKAVERGKFPANVVQALARDGITVAGVRAALTGVARPGGPLTLKSILGQPALPAGSAQVLAGDVRSFTADALSALVKGVRNTGAISQSLADQLSKDANSISGASSPSARADAVNKTIADAAQATGEAGTLLTTAAKALAQ